MPSEFGSSIRAVWASESPEVNGERMSQARLDVDLVSSPMIKEPLVGA